MRWTASRPCFSVWSTPRTPEHEPDSAVAALYVTVWYWCLVYAFRMTVGELQDSRLKHNEKSKPLGTLLLSYHSHTTELQLIICVAVCMCVCLCVCVCAVNELLEDAKEELVACKGK